MSIRPQESHFYEFYIFQVHAQEISRIKTNQQPMLIKNARLALERHREFYLVCITHIKLLCAVLMSIKST